MNYEEENEEENRPITIYDLAIFRLGREASDTQGLTGADFEKVSLPIMGGCAICHASVAAYNSCPSKSGFIKCLNACIGDDGYYNVEHANIDMFPNEYEWKGLR